MDRIDVKDLETSFLEEVTALDRRIFPDSPWGLESFRDHLNHTYDFPVMALFDNRLVGYGILRQIDAGEILLVGVDPDFRRKGIGKQLVEELLSRSEPETEVFLEVRDSNEAAKRLYETCGFTGLSRRKNYYQNPQEDAVIMRYCTKREK